jgi:tol-pal system protein YbgF
MEGKAMAYRTILPAALALLLAGCPGKQEIQQIQTDLDEIKRQMYELNRLEQETKQLVQTLSDQCGISGLRASQADLNQSVEVMRSEVQSLSTRLQSLSRNEAVLSEKLEQCLRRAPAPATSGAARPYSSTPAQGPPPNRPAAPLTPPEQRPEELYKTAYGDYIQDNFDLAIEGFRQLLSAYPDSELADNAEYWIAESYYRQGRVDQALNAFDSVVKRYPEGDKVPDAMVRKAFLLFERRQPAQAAVILNEVLDRYAGTPAAGQARDKLRAEGFLD